MICCKCHNFDPYDHHKFFWFKFPAKVNNSHLWSFWPNDIDVSFQIFWTSKELFTKIKFVISLPFLDCLDVFIQISWLREVFSTRVTIVIYLSIMECVEKLELSLNLGGSFLWKIIPVHIHISQPYKMLLLNNTA